MLLFSYGSNHPKQLRERLGHPLRGARAASLHGWVRAFRGFSRTWGGGVATLVPEKRGDVYGYVAEVTEEDLRTLDRYEGVAGGFYERTAVRPRTSSGPVRAIAYVSTSSVVSPPSWPYLQAVAKTISSFWKGEGGQAVTAEDVTVR